VGLLAGPNDVEKDGNGCVLDIDFVSVDSTVECVDAAGHVERLRL
jgi:hypothetical protein